MRNWKFPSDFEEVVTVISIARREILTRITKVRGRERIRTRIRASNLPEICISATTWCSRGTSTSMISIHFKTGNLNLSFSFFLFFFSSLLSSSSSNRTEKISRPPICFSSETVHTYLSRRLNKKDIHPSSDYDKDTAGEQVPKDWTKSKDLCSLNDWLNFNKNLGGKRDKSGNQMIHECETNQKNRFSTI